MCGGACLTGILLGAITEPASVVAGLLVQVAIALYAVVLNLLVWDAWRIAVDGRRRRAGCAAGGR